MMLEVCSNIDVLYLFSAGSPALSLPESAANSLSYIRLMSTLSIGSSSLSQNLGSRALSLILDVIPLHGLIDDFLMSGDFKSPNKGGGLCPHSGKPLLRCLRRHWSIGAHLTHSCA